jgi:hypothetical protein
MIEAMVVGVDGTAYKRDGGREIGAGAEAAAMGTPQ